MANFLFGMFRDLYIVLLIILIIEQIPGSDFLHDFTRKGVITVTICVVVVKLVQLTESPAAGGTPRAPRRQKKTEGGKNTLLEWASSEMQGWRPAMEDATLVVSSLPEPLTKQALFAVFDGHGGAQVSCIASREFTKVLTACASMVPQASEDEASAETAVAENCEDESEAAGRAGGCDGESQRAAKSSATPGGFHGKALHHALLAMDASLRKGGSGVAASAMPPAGPLGIMARQLETSDKRNAYNLVGSTAIVALVDCGDGLATGDSAPARPRRVVVANCGDSRAILCRKGKAVELSEDHKPELPGEEERIRRAGGHVALTGPCHRIDGWGLNLSRALGDFHYKARSDLPAHQQKVIAVPEIRTLELNDDDEFLVLGCDGCFELNTSQKVVDIVRRGFEMGRSVQQVTEDLVDKSCSSNLMKTRGKGGDNCSAIVVRIR